MKYLLKIIFSLTPILAFAYLYFVGAFGLFGNILGFIIAASMSIILYGAMTEGFTTGDTTSFPAFFLFIISIVLTKLFEFINCSKYLKEANELPVSDIMIKKRARKLVLVSFIYLAGIIFLNNNNIVSAAGLNLIAIMIIILGIYYINFLMLVIRIKCGYYGNNIYEAREIISFILENIDEDDSDGNKRVFADNVFTPIELENYLPDGHKVLN